MLGSWIKAQVSIKVNFHLNVSIVEELDTMLLSVLIRKQRIRLRNQRRLYLTTSRKGRDSIEKFSMISKIAVHQKTQLNFQVKKEHQNLF